MVAIHRNVTLHDESASDHSRQFACVIVCDISGFVKVANAHSTLFGPKAGAEKTRIWLDKIFDLIVGKVLKHGGEIVQFVGDAVIARFAATQVGDAIDCGQEIVLTCQQFNTGAPSAPHTRIRVGLGRGDSELVTLECTTGRKLTAVLGQATERALHALQLATSRFQVVCHASMAQGAPNSHVLKTYLNSDRSYFGLESPAPLGKPVVAFNQFSALGVTSYSNEIKLITVLYVEFVPLQYAVSWVYFLVDFNLHLPPCLAEYQATLTGFCQTDRGFRVQFVLGQINSHESDVERAIQLARKIQEMPSLGFQSISARASVGYGHMWQGDYQRENLCWFHAHGREVNLASRVLELTPMGQIYLTEGASSRVSGNTQLVELASVPVKGESKAVRAFRIPFAHEVFLAKDTFNHVSHGRSYQLGQLVSWLDEASRLSHPMLVQVTGSAGVGKTSLLRGFHQILVEKGFTVIELKANPQSKLFPYSVAYQLLLELFSTQKLTGTVESWVIDTLESHHGLKQWIGLLNLITPLKLDQFESPIQLGATVKVEATAHIYRTLLQAVTSKANLFFFIEDVQWFDELSLQLIADTIFRMPTFKCAYTARTDGDLYKHLVSRSDFFPKVEVAEQYFHEIDLRPFDVSEVQSFLQDWFDVDQVPTLVAETIQRLSDGNLLLLTALCQGLLQTGIFRQNFVERSLTINYPQFEIFTAVPLDVEHAVQVRTDKLSLEHRKVLRQCSIFRSAFTIDELQQVFSYSSKTELDEAFIQLQHHRLIRPWLVTPEGTTFRFEHQVIEQCIYERIPLEERSLLHAQCAAWLSAHIGNLPASIGDRLSIRLAAQYQLAGMTDKAIPLSKRVAQYAYQIGALDDALERIDSIIEWLSGSSKAEAANFELASWFERKAQIHFVQGQFKDSEINYIRVLKGIAMWRCLPKASESEIKRAFRRLAARRWLPRWLVTKKRNANTLEILAFRAYLCLSELSFHFARFDESYQYLLCSMKIATEVEISNGDLPKAYAGCALAASALGEPQCAAYFAEAAQRGLSSMQDGQELARARAHTYHRLGYMAYASANFDLSYEMLLDAVEGARESFEFQTEALAFSILPIIRVAQGRYEEALDLIDEYDLMVKRFTENYYNVFHQYALINHRVFCLAMLGRHEEATLVLGYLDKIISEYNFPELSRLAVARCKLALIYQQKRWPEARAQASAIAALPAQESITKAFLVSCISLPLNVLLDAHEEDKPLCPEELKAVDVLLSKLAQASQLHDLAKPVHLILDVRVRLIKNADQRPLKHLVSQALELAHRNGQQVEVKQAEALLVRLCK